MDLLMGEEMGGLQIGLVAVLFAASGVVSGYNLFGVYDACKTFSKDQTSFVDGVHTYFWVVLIASILGVLGMGFLSFNPELWMVFQGPQMHMVRFLLMGMLFSVGIFGVVVHDACADIEDSSSMTTGYVLSIIVTSLGVIALANFVYPFLHHMYRNHKEVAAAARVSEANAMNARAAELERQTQSLLRK